jgi:hypothetical protein
MRTLLVLICCSLFIASCGDPSPSDRAISSPTPTAVAPAPTTSLPTATEYFLPRCSDCRASWNTHAAVLRTSTRYNPILLGKPTTNDSVAAAISEQFSTREERIAWIEAWFYVQNTTPSLSFQAQLTAAGSRVGIKSVAALQQAAAAGMTKASSRWTRAKAAGIRMTPTVVIRGKRTVRLVGPVSEQRLKIAVQRATK